MKAVMLSWILFFSISGKDIQAQMSLSGAPVWMKNDSLPDIKKDNGWIKPVLGAGYAGVTWLCYRYFDKQLQDESQEGKTRLKNSISNTITNLGLGKVQTIGLGGTAFLA